MISKKLYPKQKRRNLTPLFIILLLTPYMVGFTADSTNSYTELIIGGGGGQYVYHDCSGVHKKNYSDAGAFIRKKYSGPLKLGLGVGGWSGARNGQSYFVAVPEIALDWKYFSFGTTGLRLGAQDQLYLEAKAGDEPPFFSGKGLLRVGVGGKLNDADTRFWLGSNVLPYNTAGIATQIEFPVSENNYLFFNGRFGKEKESGFEEYGFSIGMKFRSY